MTYGGLICPPDSAQEIFEYIANEKFRDITLLNNNAFKNTFVSAKNYYITTKCTLTWMIEEDDSYTGAETTSAQLLQVRDAEKQALYSSKRYIIVDEVTDEDVSGFEIECPSGTGVSSDELYCGKLNRRTFYSEFICPNQRPILRARAPSG